MSTLDFTILDLDFPAGSKNKNGVRRWTGHLAPRRSHDRRRFARSRSAGPVIVI